MARLRHLFGFVAISWLTTLWSAESAEPPGRVWKHPAELLSQPSLRRWFLRLPPQLQYSEVRFQSGDDPRWAQLEWDDSAWRISGFWDLPARAGVFWIRFRVRMGDGQPLPGGLMTSSVIAYEAFWDGVLIGNSGVPATNRDAEIPGRTDNWVTVPTTLLGPGEHVVAIRASSYRCGFPSAKTGIRFFVDSPAVLQGKVVREALGPTVAAGAMFMVGAASFIMWLLAARRGALLLLAAMCGCIVIMQGLHAARWFFEYPADWHYPALTAMVWLVGLQGLCMVAFVVVHFAVPRRGLLLGGLVPVFGAVSWLSPERMNLEGVYILMVSVAASLACAVWAAWHRRRDAWPSVIGILLSAILLLWQGEDFRTNFFLKFLPAMLGLMASLALHLHDERRRAQAAQLAAARLELEVLKKNIQPHFLLNTLATIMETIEQEPKTASALVESLAGEFRILSRVAGEKLIPLGQELELCRAHLRVMSLRKGVTCSFAAEGLDERSLVPPAIFHTLIENGLTHLLPRDGRQEFELTAERSADGISYRLIARGRPGADRRGGAPDGASLFTEGTGLRYIKARLEESFTGRWTIDGGPIDDGWKTVIVVRADESLRAPAKTGGAAGVFPRGRPV